MYSQFRLRLPAVAVLYLCVTISAAQEQPVEAPAPPVEETAVAPQVAPVPETAPEATIPVETPAVEVATPAPEGTPAGAKRIVMLPVEFTVYQKSVAGIEAVPDWTETATFSLGDAAIKMLSQDQRFQVVSVPQFEGETKNLLREHVEFFKIVGNTALSMAQYGGKAIAEKSTNFEYTLRDGLAFHGEAADADYAFILGGTQVTQTGGSVFMQFLAAAGGYATAGGGTYVMAGIVDLRTGRIVWLNSRAGTQVFGMTGSDIRQPATAAEVVTRMFEGFPENKFFKFPAF